MSKALQEAFDGLIAPHLGHLFRTAYGLARNRADADDLLQDTCIAACEQLEALERADSPRRWLVRVLYNRFIDGARRKKRLPVVALDTEAAAHDLASSEPTPEDAMRQRELRRALERAFLQLEETQRAVLVLRGAGYALSEIEAITGIGIEVLRARLHRARKSLARHLEQPTDDAGAARTGSRR